MHMVAGRKGQVAGTHCAPGLRPVIVAVCVKRHPAPEMLRIPARFGMRVYQRQPVKKSHQDQQAQGVCGSVYVCVYVRV